jgi:type I restriction enzyme M protein
VERARQGTENVRPQDDQAVAAAEEQVRLLTKEAREAAARAKEIDHAVYDLKAVNPHRKPVLDTRTPEELLDLIEAKGRQIAAAIALLRHG